MEKNAEGSGDCIWPGRIDLKKEKYNSHRRKVKKPLDRKAGVTTIQKCWYIKKQIIHL